MSSSRWFPLVLSLLACTARASTGVGGAFNEVDAGSPDVPAAPVDVPVAVTDRGAAPVDVPVAVTDTPAPTDVFVPITDVVVPPADACVRTGNEDDNGQCGDGRDNDCDGFIDCVDFSCRMNPAVTLCAVDAGCVPTLEDTNSACGDGRDNDCDGFIDCNDFNCTMSPSVTVCPRDGGVAPRDVGCVPAPEDTNSACGDGRDNDCDGFIDCNDFNCSSSPSVTLCPRDAGAAPRDVLFRDAPRGDSAGCVRSGDENNVTACTDGRDNDCDGYLDCDDRNCSCVGACGAAVIGCVCNAVETSNGVCRNGIDDDCNGFIDCNDFGCSRNPSVSVCLDGGL